MGETCYMCEAPATSREHVPPQCLFPNAAAIGRDLRRNLITVPSCDAHNSQKSEDDEFLRATLCLPTAGKSDASTAHFLTKVLAGARRSPRKYAGYAPKEAAISPPGTSVFTTSRDRFDRCIEHMANALCFHTYGPKWGRAFAVASPQLLTRTADGRLQPNPYAQAAIDATRQVLAGEPIRGENPEVFVYRIKLEDDVLAFGALFYGAFEVFAASSPDIADEVQSSTDDDVG